MLQNHVFICIIACRCCGNPSDTPLLNKTSANKMRDAPLLHHGGELPDALALLAQHILRAGGADDDLSAERRHAHLHTRVSLLRKLLGKKLGTQVKRELVILVTAACDSDMGPSTGIFGSTASTSAIGSSTTHGTDGKFKVTVGLPR